MGKVLVERKKKEKEKRGGGWLGYDFFKRRMTERQCVLYREQVERSECFDVQTPRSVTDCGLIRPVSRRAEMKRYSLLAINKYNNLRSKHEPETPRLKFVKVLKAMSEVCNVARFYITFEAKEEDSAGGQTKTYQTVVHKPPASMPVTVLSFRECEREKGSGNIRGKDWVWKGHTSI